MASSNKDPTQYAHPLFQSEQLPKPFAKKNKTSNKKLPKWMTHKAKQDYTSYLVHTNATTLTPNDYRPPRHVGGFEPAGNQFELFEDFNDLEEFEPSGALKGQIGLAQHFLDNLRTNMIGPKKKLGEKVIEDVDRDKIKEDLKELRDKLTEIKTSKNPASLITALVKKAGEVEEELDKIGFKNNELKFEKYKSKEGHKQLFKDLKNFEKLSVHWVDNDTVIKGGGDDGKDYKGKGIEYARKHIEWKAGAKDRAKDKTDDTKRSEKLMEQKSKLSEEQQDKVNSAKAEKDEKAQKKKSSENKENPQETDFSMKMTTHEGGSNSILKGETSKDYQERKNADKKKKENKKNKKNKKK